MITVNNLKINMKITMIIEKDGYSMSTELTKEQLVELPKVGIDPFAMTISKAVEHIDYLIAQDKKNNG